MVTWWAGSRDVGWTVQVSKDRDAQLHQIHELPLWVHGPGHAQCPQWRFATYKVSSSTRICQWRQLSQRLYPPALLWWANSEVPSVGVSWFERHWRSWPMNSSYTRTPPTINVDVITACPPYTAVNCRRCSFSNRRCSYLECLAVPVTVSRPYHIRVFIHSLDFCSACEVTYLDILLDHVSYISTYLLTQWTLMEVAYYLCLLTHGCSEVTLQ